MVCCFHQLSMRQQTASFPPSLRSLTLTLLAISTLLPLSHGLRFSCFPSAFSGFGMITELFSDLKLRIHYDLLAAFDSSQ